MAVDYVMRLRILQQNMTLQLALIDRQLEVIARHFGPEVWHSNSHRQAAKLSPVHWDVALGAPFPACTCMACLSEWISFKDVQCFMPIGWLRGLLMG